jgi:hypothetical protein
VYEVACVEREVNRPDHPVELDDTRRDDADEPRRIGCPFARLDVRKRRAARFTKLRRVTTEIVRAEILR